jgi:hypothetical protein
VQHLRRQPSSYSSPWEPEISPKHSAFVDSMGWIPQCLLWLCVTGPDVR